jgi:hypothetical protein
MCHQRQGGEALLVEPGCNDLLLLPREGSLVPATVMPGGGRWSAWGLDEG